MQEHELVGIVLVAGLAVFLIGAGGWKLAYEQPLLEALPVIHVDRRRRAWIHLWMIPAMFLTSAGVLGLVAVAGDGVAVVLSLMAGVVYAIGAVCWVASLAFRLTVIPWAAEQTAQRGVLPEGFAALDSWAGSLYSVHMVSAYVAFAILGSAVLVDGALPRWAGWAGIVGGLGFVGGFLATRREGPFNPPFWAHLYTALLGVLLLS
ncbi:MAG: hypothetical protein EA340_11755 [Nitriliruptor sp.]|nr:MAG: hypothetical protein EA340_11755 [Nitriliruptor sp.]